MQRVATSAPLSPMQTVVADLLGLGLTAEEVAAELDVTVHAIRHHVRKGAAKIPSDLPAQMAMTAWARGATADVLQGITLKVEIMNRRDKRRCHSDSVVQLPANS